MLLVQRTIEDASNVNVEIRILVENLYKFKGYSAKKISKFILIKVGMLMV